MKFTQNKTPHFISQDNTDECSHVFMAFLHFWTFQESTSQRVFRNAKEEHSKRRWEENLQPQRFTQCAALHTGTESFRNASGLLRVWFALYEKAPFLFCVTATQHALCWSLNRLVLVGVTWPPGCFLSHKWRRICLKSGRCDWHVI